MEEDRSDRPRQAHLYIAHPLGVLREMGRNGPSTPLLLSSRLSGKNQELSQKLRVWKASGAHTEGVDDCAQLPSYPSTIKLTNKKIRVTNIRHDESVMMTNDP